MTNKRTLLAFCFVTVTGCGGNDSQPPPVVQPGPEPAPPPILCPEPTDAEFPTLKPGDLLVWHPSGHWGFGGTVYSVFDAETLAETALTTRDGCGRAVISARFDKSRQTLAQWYWPRSPRGSTVREDPDDTGMFVIYRLPDTRPQFIEAGAREARTTREVAFTSEPNTVILAGFEQCPSGMLDGWLALGHLGDVMSYSSLSDAEPCTQDDSLVRNAQPIVAPDGEAVVLTTHRNLDDGSERHFHALQWRERSMEQTALVTRSDSLVTELAARHAFLPDSSAFIAPLRDIYWPRATPGSLVPGPMPRGYSSFLRVSLVDPADSTELVGERPEGYSIAGFGSERRVLGDGRGVVWYDGSWSSGGMAIRRDGNTTGPVYFVPSEGGAPYAISPPVDEFIHAMHLPDDRAVAAWLASGASEEECALRIHDFDTDRTVTVTEAFTCGDWPMVVVANGGSSDAMYVAMRRSYQTPFELFIVTASQDGVVVAAQPFPDGHMVRDLEVSPDGVHLYYAGPSTGLQRMALATGEVERILPEGPAGFHVWR